MFRFLSIFLIVTTMSACSAQDKEYYWMHPKHLQKALQTCPDKPPKLITCAELEDIADKMNQLGYELRSSPQKFGNTILAIQEKIALQEEKLKNQPNQSDVKESLQEMQRELKERMAVVRWLESPEG